MADERLEKGIAVHACAPAANTAFAVAKAVFAAPGESVAEEGRRQRPARRPSSPPDPDSRPPYPREPDKSTGPRARGGLTRRFLHA